MNARLPLVVMDLLRTVKAYRDAERRGNATEIRQLQALVDAGLESAYGSRGQEAPPGADRITLIKPSTGSIEHESLALAREALATLAVQKKYFTRRDPESLREARDRERRLEQRALRMIDWHQPSLFDRKAEDIMEPVGVA